MTQATHGLLLFVVGAILGGAFVGFKMSRRPALLAQSVTPAITSRVTSQADSLDAALQWWKNNPDSESENQNRFDVSRNEQLRQKIAPSLQKFFPGILCCEHCQWPWTFVDSHSVSFGNGHGGFVLCEHCWKYLLSYGREDVIRQLHHDVRKRHWPDVTAEQLDAALDDQFGGKDFRFHAVHPEQAN